MLSAVEFERQEETKTEGVETTRGYAESYRICRRGRKVKYAIVAAGCYTHPTLPTI